MGSSATASVGLTNKGHTVKKKTIWITSAAVATVLVVGGAGLAIADPFDSPVDADGPLTGNALDQASAAALDAVGSGTVTDTETETGGTDPNAYEVEVTLADGTEVDVALDKSFAVLWVDDEAGRSDDDGTSDSGADDSAGRAAVSDADRDAASAAALATLPAGTAGTVTEVEPSDDVDHAWEVEITLDNGQDVDVELDAGFAVLKVDGAPAA
ncbi:hypothetical protein E3O42_09315 [Cryobacterium adonitolivorans]|uniref:PepSY domain-containing protein n=1 Tax=Cryobacterium adonitolivorans TaxID=1259189 RepID=A0A4R8W364_9MICO|nr:PepSY domain-containing protein [Cryobacterium adonitolivorans]TFC01577.1 hypothetical protein E3O42_09315 [Cryobacterium adonitolivorans]